MSVFLSQIHSILPAIMLVLFLIVFLGIIYFTYRPSQKSKFEEYGRIPLKENDDVKK